MDELKMYYNDIEKDISHISLLRSRSLFIEKEEYTLNFLDALLKLKEIEKIEKFKILFTKYENK